MSNPFLLGAVQLIRIEVVSLAVVIVIVLAGTPAALMFAVLLNGPHPYLFCTLTLILYVVPATTAEVVKVVSVLRGDRP